MLEHHFLPWFLLFLSRYFLLLFSFIWTHIIRSFWLFFGITIITSIHCLPCGLTLYINAYYYYMIGIYTGVPIRSSPCAFLGYRPKHHGYWCLDLAIHKTYITIHIRFDELRFPFFESQLSPPPSLPTDSTSSFFVGPPLALFLISLKQHELILSLPTPHLLNLPLLLIISLSSNSRVSPFPCLFFQLVLPTP